MIFYQIVNASMDICVIFPIMILVRVSIVWDYVIQNLICTVLRF